MDDRQRLHARNVIERVRRAMPRNPDVMELCDILDKTLPLTVRRIMDVVPPVCAPASASVNIALVNKSVDVNSRKVYMREYMRQRRAAQKPQK